MASTVKNDITSLKMHAVLLAQFRCLRDVTVDFWASALPFRAGLACAPCVHHDLIPLKFQCCIVGAFVSRFVHAPEVPFPVPPKTPKMGVFGYFGVTENGTSGARIKILRPLFNTNTPPKTPI